MGAACCNQEKGNLDSHGGKSPRQIHTQTMSAYRDSYEEEDAATCFACDCDPPRFIFFEIELDKSRGSTLGVNVDRKDGKVLYVDAITKGLISEWNSLNPHKQVVRGDAIVEVNGARGNADFLIEACKQCRLLRCKIRRRAAPSQGVLACCSHEEEEIYEVQLDKATGKGLGIGVDHRNVTSLQIDSIESGLVEDWNSMNPQRKVMVGDEIFEVNGVGGHVGDIMEECKKPIMLRCKLKRRTTSVIWSFAEELV
mmetsp:Transcript_121951/g.316739  ORF Transcript_121951/g.316739 Transcript_121951/m.316739 type:complete len:254 (+) Transcript_121951:81-842(+)